MLQKILKVVVLFAFILVMKAGAQSGSPSPITIDPAIRIVQPITLEKVAGKDLHFGKFAAYISTVGSVTITPSGTRTRSGEINLLDGGVSYGAAQFTVNGLEGALFSLDLPLTTTVTNETYITDVMQVSEYTTDLAEPYTIGTGGVTTFNVGATLTKGEGDRRGTYSGSFSLTVNYL